MEANKTSIKHVITIASLVLGCVYYLIKYKFLLGNTKNILFHIITSTFFIVLVVIYSLYIKLDNKVDSWIITTTLLTCIGGTAFDLVINIYPERGCWATLLALIYMIIEVEKIYSTDSIIFILGCVLMVSILMLYGVLTKFV